MDKNSQHDPAAAYEKANHSSRIGIILIKGFPKMLDHHGYGKEVGDIGEKAEKDGEDVFGLVDVVPGEKSNHRFIVLNFNWK